MTLATGADPRSDSIHINASRPAVGEGWANVRPLERGGVDAVGQCLDLLAAISHELRTPLNAVIGFSEAMHHEVFGPIGNARYREYVGHIRSSGAELLRAAEDALAMTAVLAHPKAVAFEDVALGALVSDAVDDVAGRSREICAFEVDVDAGLEVRGDRRILARAIRQLVGVAYARAGEGSLLRVAASSDHGLVELLIEVSDAEAEQRSRADLQASPFELGLGRRELALWLATALFDLMDCRLQVETVNGSLRLRTALEQSCRGLFLCDEVVAAG